MLIMYQDHNLLNGIRTDTMFEGMVEYNHMTIDMAEKTKRAA